MAKWRRRNISVYEIIDKHKLIAVFILLKSSKAIEAGAPDKVTWIGIMDIW